MEKSRLVMALGCNYNHEMNMKRAQEEICTLFNESVVFTSMKWTSPIGIKSGMFLNCLAMTYTDLEYGRVRKALKHIETVCGNTNDDRMNNVVNMDIDILMYGDDRFHVEDWRREYVKELIRELDIQGK